MIPGSVVGCFTMDSLLLSTLECYYSDVCLSAQYQVINQSFSLFPVGSTWFKAQPLIYDAESSRFPPDTVLSVVVKEIMIEKWNSSFSFNHYYYACAPLYCSYSLTQHTSNVIGVILKMISTIGGLTMALRIVTPHMVAICKSLLKSKRRRQHQGNSCLNISIFLHITVDYWYSDRPFPR